jgi:hypothetical protein
MSLGLIQEVIRLRVGSETSALFGCQLLSFNVAQGSPLMHAGLYSGIFDELVRTCCELSRGATPGVPVPWIDEHDNGRSAAVQEDHEYREDESNS